MEIHFIDVGCGNMSLICFPSGKTYLYDCNLTDDNEGQVVAYLEKAMAERSNIDVFVCSHRDADHVRGIKTIHAIFPIGKIEDPDVPGTTTDSPEYRAYMDLRRMLPCETIKGQTYQAVGDAVVRYMNAGSPEMSDANDQSIVLKIEYKGSSVLLAGDTSFKPWKEKILPFYSPSPEKLQANILLAGHHGSLTFFDDPTDERNYYIAHIQAIKPAMTLISVGQNTFGLPDEKAIELYAKDSTGSDKGNKVYRTDEKGNIKLTLKDSGDWSLAVNQ